MSRVKVTGGGGGVASVAVASSPSCTSSPSCYCTSTLCARQSYLVCAYTSGCRSACPARFVLVSRQRTGAPHARGTRALRARRDDAVRRIFGVRGISAALGCLASLAKHPGVCIHTHALVWSQHQPSRQRSGTVAPDLRGRRIGHVRGGGSWRVTLRRASHTRDARG